MSTVAALLARVRVHLQELTEGSTPEFQDDEQLIPYISDSHQWVANEMSLIDEAGWFEKDPEATLVVPADADSVALPSDFGRVIAVDWVVANGTRIPIEPITQAQRASHRMATVVTGGDTGPKPGYYLRGSKFVALPVRSSDQTFYMAYVYTPAAVAVGGTLETPADWDHVIARRAAIIAALDAKQNIENWSRSLATELAEMVRKYTKRHASGTVSQIDDTFTQALLGG